jgi:hypothetical protein
MFLIQVGICPFHQSRCPHYAEDSLLTKWEPERGCNSLITFLHLHVSLCDSNSNTRNAFLHNNIKFFFVFNATTCPYRLRRPTFWLWPKYNRLQSVGAPIRRGYVAPMMCERGVPRGALNPSSTSYPDHGRCGNLPLQGKIPTAEPEIEPETSWLISRCYDHQARRLVITLTYDAGIYTQKQPVYITSAFVSAAKWQDPTSTMRTIIA